jgi:hypothetical protein
MFSNLLSILQNRKSQNNNLFHKFQLNTLNRIFNNKIFDNKSKSTHNFEIINKSLNMFSCLCMLI